MTEIDMSQEPAMLDATLLMNEKIAENAEKKRKHIQSLDVAELKHLMEVNDPRGKEWITEPQKRIWYNSYDALEKLLDDEEFEDFLDTLD